MHSGQNRAATPPREHTRAGARSPTAHLPPLAPWCPSCLPLPRAPRGTAARSFAARTLCTRAARERRPRAARSEAHPARAVPHKGTHRVLHQGSSAPAGARGCRARPARNALGARHTTLSEQERESGEAGRAPAAHHRHPKPRHPKSTLAETATTIGEGHAQTPTCSLPTCPTGSFVEMEWKH